jgi:catechol 2,3-dioxygenase-like lactoylglutathione lyase family enzyme
MRRAAVMVRDLDRSLTLYRDVLGLAVWRQGDAFGNDTFFRLLGVAPARARFAILQSEGSQIGMVGLFEVTEPSPASLRRVQAPAINLGEVALVFLASGVRELHERVTGLGLTVVCPPVRFDVPGGGVTLEMTFRDFDGALVNVFDPQPPQ